MEESKWQNFEIWKPIIGGENKYYISNTGKIKKFSITKRSTDKILKKTINSKGYYQISKKGLIKSTGLLHRLLAIHFIPNPNNYKCVNHIDGNKLNYSLDNLEWCTHSQNTTHSYKIGLQKTSNKRILKISKKVLNIKTLEIYNSAKEAAFKNNLNYNTLMCRLNGSITNNTNLKYLENEN